MKELFRNRLQLQPRVGAALLTALIAGACTRFGAVPRAAFATDSHVFANLSVPKGDLLYVTAAPFVYVYTYPQGNLIQKLTVLGAEGLCVDRVGNIFITIYNNAHIEEFAHGGTSPIATLSDPASKPIACAVEPKTGNLAIVNYAGTLPKEPGSVALYSLAKGSGILYRAPRFFFYSSCVYDSAGNLFIDGQTSHFEPVMAEMKKGESKFTGIPLPKELHNVILLGGISWDGKFLVLGDLDRDILYRITVKGSTATVVGKTKLSAGNAIYQFFIRRRSLIAVNVGSGNTMFWRYPQGGDPYKTIGEGTFDAGVSSLTR